VARRVEPDPQTWWERYGHRLEGHSDRTRSGEAVGEPVEEHPDAQHAGGPLTEDAIVRRPDEVPPPGWRRWVHWWTGGLIDPGPGRDELARRALLHRIRRPLPEIHRVAVTSIKGGVGKTTVAACLGLVLAEHRGDRVVVLDANPDAGTLADRLTGESTVTVRELLRDLDRIRSWADMSRYTSLAGRLQVLASEQDPASGDAFSREEYGQVSALLARFFDLAVTDSGTGLVHSAMAGTLDLADGVIVVGAPTVDGAGRAAKTLDWLLAHGHSGLAADALVVLSHDRVSSDVDARRIHEHFATRCRAVVDVPHDPHLATGGRIELTRLRPATRNAFLELAALVTDRFPAGATVDRGTGEHRCGGPTLEG
jgi:MinD-like ATPase involved in chromosome partitioning or flagellar assembly